MRGAAAVWDWAAAQQARYAEVRQELQGEEQAARAREAQQCREAYNACMRTPECQEKRRLVFARGRIYQRSDDPLCQNCWRAAPWGAIDGHPVPRPGDSSQAWGGTQGGGHLLRVRREPRTTLLLAARRAVSRVHFGLCYPPQPRQWTVSTGSAGCGGWSGKAAARAATQLATV
jgi:hypothetical protein